MTNEKYNILLDSFYVDIESIAKRFNVDEHEVEMVAIECAENIAMDAYMQECIYDEYQGDVKKIKSWFESYVLDVVQESI